MSTVAIDFDGVIHLYSNGWLDGSIYDLPIKGALDTINDFQLNGWSVIIISTRNPYEIRRWFERLLIDNPDTSPPLKFKVLPWWSFWVKFWYKTDIVAITQRKLPANVYIDDRALSFDGNWENTFDKAMVFETWQGRH